MVDVLSFLADVHPRLNVLAHDFLSIRHLDLTGVSTIKSRCSDLCPTAEEVLSRLVAKTLPRLHSQVHQMTVESDSIKESIAAGTYPQLYSISLRHFQEEFLRHCLTGLVVDLLHCPWRENSPLFLFRLYRWSDLPFLVQIDHTSSYWRGTRRRCRGQVSIADICFDSLLMFKMTRIGIRPGHLGLCLGEDFFLLLPQRLPICHVDPLNINGRWICWLSPSARWTVRISFDADHPCQWCLSSCDEHRQQGKSNQSIFSMLIFLLFLETTDEVQVFLIHLVWPDPSLRLSDCSDDSSNGQSRRFAILSDSFPTRWWVHGCWGIVWSPSQSSGTTTKVYISYSEHLAQVLRSHIASDEWGLSTELRWQRWSASGVHCTHRSWSVVARLSHFFASLRVPFFLRAEPLFWWGTIQESATCHDARQISIWRGLVLHHLSRHAFARAIDDREWSSTQKQGMFTYSTRFRSSGECGSCAGAWWLCGILSFEETIIFTPAEEPPDRRTNTRKNKGRSLQGFSTSKSRRCTRSRGLATFLYWMKWNIERKRCESIVCALFFRSTRQKFPRSKHRIESKRIGHERKEKEKRKTCGSSFFARFGIISRLHSKTIVLRRTRRCSFSPLRFSSRVFSIRSRSETFDWNWR